MIEDTDDDESDSSDSSDDGDDDISLGGDDADTDSEYDSLSSASEDEQLPAARPPLIR